MRASSAGANARKSSGGRSEAHTRGAGRGTAAEAGTTGVACWRYLARVEAAGALRAWLGLGVGVGVGLGLGLGLG